MKYSRQYIRNTFLQIIKQGLTYHKLALTCSAGVIIGIFPVFGITTILCFAVAAIFRLNLLLIQLVNYMVAPLQLLLIIPFIKVGTIVFRLNPVPYDSEQLVLMFRHDFMHLLREVGLSLLLGVGVWATFSVPLFFVLYYLFFILFRRWLKSPQRELKSQ